ncbi:MAG: TonB-dependent receptor, plug, partial [Bryobacterales bacterium]|nr:TonB-dependent receptor, plug [Bryobacterales bacterium]
MTKQGIFLLRSLLALGLALPALAQFDTAEVLGTVKDRSDAVVANASVRLTNENTGIEASTATDASGSYAFSNVKIGTYRISAEAAGFSRGEARGITVNVNARQRVDLVLQVGTVTETVQVTGAASALQTDSSERGQVVSQQAIVELPLNGRS